MKLKLEEGYTIVEPFEIDLPDLTILTGINGSGKTQIINGIIKGLIKTNLEGSIASINHEILTNPETHQIMGLNNHLTSTEMWGIYRQYLEGYNEAGEEHMMYKDWNWIFVKISNITKKDIKSLDVNDIYSNWPIEHDVYEGGKFYQNFHKIFYRYLKKQSENDFNNYLKEKYPEKATTALSEDSFIELFGESPWSFANAILAHYGSNYQFKDPGRFNFDLKYEDKFNFKLYNIVSNIEIEFDQLSSGEKTIMAIFFQLYNISFDYVKPSLILMDEADASLHPSLIKQFLDIIENVFIKYKNIKVILTIHSPTTVALADEESIYSVISPGATIEKITKDGALKLLTEGVPSFSVNYENRRHVFVESQNDVEYYENLYKIFSSELDPEISLNFIAAGSVQKNRHGGNKDGSDIVISVTDMLLENKFIYGIVDYDDKNTPNDYLKVLGYRKRYAIENYILDPLLLATFLLMKDIEKPEDIGLEAATAYYDIPNLDPETLQILANRILGRIKDSCEINSEELVTCKLYNGIEIHMPKWFLIHKGHQLEKNIKNAFKGLGKYSNPEKKLKISIIRNVISNYPELASEDLIQILKEVQK